MGVDNNILLKFVGALSESAIDDESAVRSLRYALNVTSHTFQGINILRPDHIDRKDVKVVATEEILLPDRDLLGNLQEKGILDTIQIKDDEDYIYRVRIETASLYTEGFDLYYFSSKPEAKDMYRAEEFLTIYYTLYQVNEKLMNRVYPNGFDKLTSLLETYDLGDDKK